MAFLNHLTLGWPQLIPARHLTPSMHCTLVCGPFYQIWWSQGIFKEFDLWLTPADPCMTFDPSNELHFDQGFFLPNLGSGGIEKSHSCKWAKWIQWHALPHIQQSTQQRNKGYYPNLHGWDFSIPPSPKFGGHTSFLSNLTSSWPWLTPAWPLTPAMHHALIRNSSQIWWP